MTSIISWIPLCLLPLEAIAMPHLIAFNCLVYREIELTASTLMTSSKSREPFHANDFQQKPWTWAENYH